jgi:hypothetical protein
VKLWSILSSLSLTVLTLFVFWAFQNYGPESALRRFHSVLARVNTYVPPTVPFSGEALEPIDRYELASLSSDPLNSPSERWLIDGLVRAALYSQAKVSIQRLVFRSSREAVAVVLYEFPKGTKGAAVFVLTKANRAWVVNASQTRELFRDMSGTPGRLF